MKTIPIRHQIIEKDGEPLFVLVPYEEYRDLVGEDTDEDRITIPLAVSKLSNLNGWSLIRAWREHKGLTQEDVAGRMGITRAAFAQMEAADANPRHATLRKIAEALGIEVEQITG